MFRIFLIAAAALVTGCAYESVTEISKRNNVPFIDYKSHRYVTRGEPTRSQSQAMKSAFSLTKRRDAPWGATTLGGIPVKVIHVRYDERDFLVIEQRGSEDNSKRLASGIPQLTGCAVRDIYQRRFQYYGVWNETNDFSALLDCPN